MEFIEWLETEKNFTARSAHDVDSRLRRVLSIAKVKQVDSVDFSIVEEIKEFKNLSPDVKSQLRRAYKLYCEYVGFGNR